RGADPVLPGPQSGKPGVLRNLAASPRREGPGAEEGGGDRERPGDRRPEGISEVAGDRPVAALQGRLAARKGTLDQEVAVCPGLGPDAGGNPAPGGGQAEEGPGGDALGGSPSARQVLPGPQARGDRGRPDQRRREGDPGEAQRAPFDAGESHRRLEGQVERQ